MDAFTLKLSAQDIDFLMEVLHTQPLPFNRTAPLIGAIGQQVQQQQAQAAARALTVAQASGMTGGASARPAGLVEPDGA